MLLTVGDFKKRVGSDIETLVGELQDVTGRTGKDEADAWRKSLPAVADLFSVPALEPIHVFFPGAGHAALEYQLPAASSWCDLILLGSKDNRPSALVMELKHWDTAGHLPGSVEGLMDCGGSTRLHPSRQVGNYTEYIRRFHSEILDQDALVSGCVFFSRCGNATNYSMQPNQSIAAAFPIFTTNTHDVERRFPDYVTQLINAPDERFASAFEKGRYKQDRGFVKQIGEQIQDPSKSPFVLVDGQDQAFLQCRERVRRVVDNRDGARRKHVVVVHGPPGSGKSVVAAQLWASLVTDVSTRDGNVVIATTSASQNSNWVHLVDEAAQLGGARGIVKKTTSYHPISLHALGVLERRFGTGTFSDPLAWRTHVETLRKLGPFQPGAEDDSYLVSLVDEAHALINPEHPAGRSGPLGFAVNLGPQAYHVMRASLLTVFFMDSDQGFRDRENTTVRDIKVWAGELGATFEEIDLSPLQFRCAGSKEYADWIEIIRSNTHPLIAALHARRWRVAPQQRTYKYSAVGESPVPRYLPARGMEFEIADNPWDMEGALRQRIGGGHSARLLASFSRKWKTKDVEKPHGLPAQMLDWYFAAQQADGSTKAWARPWNVIVKGDYTAFVQAPAGSAMATDPLCEVGCPYAVRGFDFDYVGLIWSNDLAWRRDRWVVLPEHVEETGMLPSLRAAKREHDLDGPAHAALLDKVWKSYRILLTRAMRGVIVFVEDQETRQHLEAASLRRHGANAGNPYPR